MLYKSLLKILILSWSDLKTRYRRSAIGPFWITISTAVGVAGLGIIWSILLKMNLYEFVPQLTIGLVLWQFLSSSITESTNVFLRNAAIIKNVPGPISLFPMLQISRSVITLLHNSIVIVAVMVGFNLRISVDTLLFIPGLIINIMIMYYLTGIVGLTGSRYRDLEQIIQSIMPIIFFLSPVIYSPSMLGRLAEYMYINPFTYMIEIVRNPLLGVSIEPFIYQNIGILFLIVYGLNKLLFYVYAKKIAYWL